MKPPREQGGPCDPEIRERIRADFARQRLMQTMGAELGAIRRGEVEIELPFQEALTQQNGYLHAGALTAIVDSACGYAAYTLMPPGSDVLSVEFKINLLAPAVGERFLAVGRVIRSGRTLTVCSGEVFALQGATRKQVCALQGTMISTRQRAEEEG